MSTPETLPGHLLLFSQTAWDHGLTIAEMQRVMREFNVWHGSLLSKGLLASGFPLGGERVRITGNGVLDGPFPETKETVGGYLELKTDDPDEALAIARSCPLLSAGVSLELRRPARECPVFQRVMEAIAVHEDPEQSASSLFSDAGASAPPAVFNHSSEPAGV
ncbi:MAG: hypothetical protein EOP86_11090 [Verrucomicrobiaceae bacterium]|nr:MAG: hypothetical protein EOP86_11090 [Verrucomicrobiaceae bacterium]